MTKVQIYTDGGADPNPGAGGWGVVLVHPVSGESHELSGGADDTTNNRMELTAAIEALETLSAASDVELFTDSTYVRQGITKWIRGWRSAGWKRSDGQAVKNVDLWQRLDRAAGRHRIDWRWVKGHAGVAGNERADQLATQEILARKNGSSVAPGCEIDGVTSVFLKVTCWPGGGLWAVLVRTTDQESRFVGEEHGSSANRLELLAACEGLARLGKTESCQVIGGSEYLRRGSEMWMAGWKQRGWLTAGGAPVKNADLWQRLERLLMEREVSWPVVDMLRSPELTELSSALKERRSAG